MFVWNEPLICGGVTPGLAELEEEGFNGFNGFRGLIPGTASDWFGSTEVVKPGKPAVGAAAGGADAGPCPPAEVEDAPEVDDPAEVDEPPEVDEPLEVDDPPEVDEPPEVDDPPEVDEPDELDPSAYAGICPVVAAPTPTRSSTVATRLASCEYSVEPIATTFRTPADEVGLVSVMDGMGSAASRIE